MTDQNSPAGAVGAGGPSGQAGSFGPQHPQQQGGPAAERQPQQLPSDMARAQVAAAWVRSQPRAGQAAVPALPPRESVPRTESKKEKRERERAARKAAYEQKKAAKQERRKGASPAAPATPTPHTAPAGPAPATHVTPVNPTPAVHETPAPAAHVMPVNPTPTAHVPPANPVMAAPAHATPAVPPVTVQAQAPAITATQTDHPAAVTPDHATPAGSPATTASAGSPVAAQAPAVAGGFAADVAMSAPTSPAPATGGAGTAPGLTASHAGGAGKGRGPGRSFDVPQPGGRIPSGGSGGRRTHVALRATLLITTCVFALGSCGVMGLMAGASTHTSTAALGAEDAARYRLTEFPLQQAASFAEQYALVCLTYSPEKAAERRGTLARYASSGVDPECGWSGEGTSTAVSATWDGTAEQLPEYGDHGRYLGIQVRTADGTLTELTVPVYVKDLASGEGMRVAGDVGQMPLPARADVPETDRGHEVVDEKLARQLQQQVLPGYFTAWGASDATAMARFTTPDASLPATSGLAGRLANPTVSEVTALVPANVQGSTPYTYPSGQAVQLRVTVDWGDPKGETVRRAYRMTVVNTAQGWFIKDIHGGVLDPQGGRADGDGSATPGASATPGTGAPASGAPSPAASRATTAPGAPSPAASGGVRSAKGKPPATH